MDNYPSTPPPIPAAPLPPPPTNLYAAPQAEANYALFQSGLIWRQGNVLVATKNTELPPLCIKTGKPANAYRILKLSWNSPWAYLGLLGGLLPFIIIALIITKRGDLRVALSPEAISKRRKWIAAGWLGFILMITAMVVGAKSVPSDSAPLLVAVGIVSLLIWIVIAVKKVA